jgi:adenosylmethionine-8-amino-7-oxononanoate aminotransferase
MAANDIAAALTHGLGPCLGMKGVRDVRVRGAIGVVELDAAPNLNDLKRRLVAEGVWVRPFRNIVYLTPALTIDEADLKTLTGAVAKIVGEGV